MVLLDTNILSELMRKVPHRKVQARLAIQAGNFCASVITLSELRFGAMLHPQPHRFWSRIETTLLPLVRWLEVDHAVALQAADINAILRQKGQTANLNDCLIAATALAHNMVLVTRDTSHFQQMPGLRLENWFN